MTHLLCACVWEYMGVEVSGTNDDGWRSSHHGRGSKKQCGAHTVYAFTEGKVVESKDILFHFILAAMC